MTDENDKTNDGQQTPTGTPSQTGPRAPLSLKPRQAGSVSTGTVRQSFSHGRTKTVVVETKRRVGAGPGHQRPQGFDVARPRTDAPAPAARQPRQESGAGGLSAEEMEARRRAIELANREREKREAEKAAAETARREAAAKSAAEAKAAAEPSPEAPAMPAAGAPAAPPAETPAAPTPAAAQTPPAAPAKPEAPARPQVNFGQRVPRKREPAPARPERP